MGGQRHALAALPLGKTRYPLYRRLGGPQGRSGWVQKISSPPGLDPLTVQSVASCYTGCYPCPSTKDIHTRNECTHVQAQTLMFSDVINVTETTVNED